MHYQADLRPCVPLALRSVNMNQVLSGVDIEIAAGNPEAIGAYGRAAQGTSIQDVTVRCADCAVGIQGGAGSGGSHINVRVEVRLTSTFSLATHFLIKS